MKSWKRPSEFKFRGFKFRGSHRPINVNFEFGTRVAVSTRNAYPDSRWEESGYARLEQRWSASLSSLAWEATTSTKHEVRWCSHT